MAEVNRRDYADDYFDKIETGTAVEGQAGKVWRHTGTGWEQTDAGALPQPGAAPSPTGSPTAQSGFGGIPGQAAAAATYSATPHATPTANTGNQGTQNTVLNSYLQQATQGTSVDKNDPAFRQQTDAFGAQTERAKSQYLSETAERLSAKGLGDSSAMATERRMASERAGEARGSFEAQLVGRELQNKRSEIQTALAQLRGILSDDQTRALQQQLADLDAQLRREGLATQSTLGTQDTAVRLQLGLLNNQDAINNTALRYAMGEYGANRDAALY